MKSIKVNILEILGALLFCLILLESLCNTIIVSLFPVSNMLGIILLCICGLIVLRFNIKFGIWKFIFILSILGAFFLNIVRHPYIEIIQYFVYFLSFGLVGLLCSSIPLNEEKIMKYANIILFINLIIIGVNRLPTNPADYFNFGYMMLPGVLISLLYTFRLKMKKNYLASLFVLSINICATYIMFLKGGRGIYVCLIIFMLLSLFLLTKNKFIHILCVMFVIMGLICLINVEKIAYIIQDLLSQYNINIYAIDKTIRLLTREGDITNGRIDLYLQVFKDLDIFKIIFGKGIAIYEIQVGTYTHNIFLSIFSDFGLVGIFVFCFLLFCLVKKIMHVEFNQRGLYVLLISVCFTKLIFSSVYWKSSGFWVLIGLALNTTTPIRNICAKLKS